jgi:hypothetical protein
VSRPSGCPTCWPDGDVRRLVEHAEQRIAAASAVAWPRTRVTFGPMVTAGGALRQQVRVGGQELCATLRPAGTWVSSVVAGHHGDLAAVRDGAVGDVDATVLETEQLIAVAVRGLRVAAPHTRVDEVMFAEWGTGTSLASCLQDQPSDVPTLATALFDELRPLHRDPPQRLRQLAAPTGRRALPRIIGRALARSVDHLHHLSARAAEPGELRALLGEVSQGLARLAARLDAVLVARAGIAFGSVTPQHVLVSPADRPLFLSPDLGPGGEPVDVGILLGHLHLLALTSPPAVRTALVEGIDTWLTGRVTAQGDAWPRWLTLVLTVWAATVYDTVVAAATLPDALPAHPAVGQLAEQALPALADLMVLTGQLRRNGALAALNATLVALAAQPANPDAVMATATARP